MAIKKFYKDRVTVQRLSNVSGSKKETFQNIKTNMPCHIQALTGENFAVDEGSFYGRERMWCADSEDIQEGDKIINGSIKYVVNGVGSRSYGRGSSNAHKDILLMRAV